MKKEDLKFKNVVELRNGDRLFYSQFCEGDLLDFDGNGCIQLINFDENLNHLYSSGYDIVKVYEDYTLTKVLWERKEKPKSVLTGVEKIILKNLPKKFKYIARDNWNNALCVYDLKPHKDSDMWTNDTDGGWKALIISNHLFQFIKWEDEKPYSIEELLNDR